MKQELRRSDFDSLNAILEGFVPGEIQKMNIVGDRTKEINAIVQKGFKPLTLTAKLTIVELRLTSISRKLGTLIAQYDRARDVTAKSHFELFKDDIDKLIEL